MTDFGAKRLIIFDMDGTLALSKAPIDSEMKELLTQLLQHKKVMVISGGAWPQFETQLVNILDLPDELKSNLFIATGGGSAMYRFVHSEREELYSNPLSASEKEKIRDALKKALDETHFDQSVETFGERLEDRGSSMAFSALGQHAPLDKKSSWDPDHSKRDLIIEHLCAYIPEFEIRTGGTTTIDITQKDIDKAYGISQASERLHIPISEMLYIGDALYPGGNDEPAIKSGVETLQVQDVNETKKVIREILGA